MYRVFVENYGLMRLAEDGFETYGEAAEWAAEQFGLARWWVLPYRRPIATGTETERADQEGGEAIEGVAA